MTHQTKKIKSQTKMELIRKWFVLDFFLFFLNLIFQSKNKKGGKKISLTPSFFGGRRGRNPSQSENGTETDNHQSDVSGIIGVKDYIPNAEKNKSTKNGRPRPENVLLFSISFFSKQIF